MNTIDDNIIGIVGGMGPHSGLMLYDHILRLTKVSTDQEHLSVILMSLPKHIADRTLYLQGNTDVNPAHNIAQMILRLENVGARIIGIACNTAHAEEIYHVIQSDLLKVNSKVKLLNMLEETCLYIRENMHNVRRIGLMTTTGTYQSGIYNKYLERLGYDPVRPSLAFQEKVIHNIIYHPEFGIKACPEPISSYAHCLIEESLGYFQHQGVDALVLGCTELSLAFKEGVSTDMPLINPMEILANALVREVFPEKKSLLPR